MAFELGSDEVGRPVPPDDVCFNEASFGSGSENIDTTV